MLKIIASNSKGTWQNQNSNQFESGMETHAFNPSTWESEAERLPVSSRLGWSI